MDKQVTRSQGQLGDPKAEGFYEKLVASKDARAQWSGVLVPQRDSAKLQLALRSLALVRKFNRRATPPQSPSASGNVGEEK